MTKYVADILKQLGIDYKQYNIRNHWDEESGDTWVTLHPNIDWRNYSSMIERSTALYDCTFGKYTIRWGEDNCYLKISGILKIGADGYQIYPLPRTDKPALFSQEYILDLWKNNQELIAE